MPSYDFYCRECGDAVTIATSIQEKLTAPICAKCKSEMIRSFGVQAIQFKGTGWAGKKSV